MDCFGTYFTHAQSCDNVHVQSATGRTASVHTHAQSYDNVHVQSATDWAASVHTLHMPKAVIKFVFEVYGMDCWRTYLTHAQICDNIRVQSATEWIVFSPFSRFRVFVFSRFRAWRFRVFAFSCSAGGIPAAGTQISCAQLWDVSWRMVNWVHKSHVNWKKWGISLGLPLTKDAIVTIIFFSGIPT